MDTPGTGSVVTASVESVTMAMTEAAPSSLRVNAICVPSGSHVGSVSETSGVVT
jgi:hypothetical protein